MKRGPPVVLLLMVAVSWVGGCSSTPRDSSSAAPPDVESPSVSPTMGESDGARVFRTKCSACHGSRGEGNLGPALAGLAIRLPAEEQLAVVQNGKGTMPPFSPALTGPEIAAVLDYVNTEFG